MQRIIILGPGHPLRGGIATFNHRLATELIKEGNECSIISFSLQYPSFLFPGTSQYSEEPAPGGVEVHSIINSINPANWLKVGARIRKWKPDIVVVRFWIPFMGPALGTILRIAKKNKNTKVICIADNIIPHENRPADVPFTKYFLKACDAFITMSEKVLQDLKKFDTLKPACLIPHPLYDNFGERLGKAEARHHLGLDVSEKIILFFGFIRKYKGLDILLQAMADERIKKERIKLVVAGEFYEDEKPFLELIQANGIEQNVILKTNFIPDSEVRYYLCSADCVVQPYRSATQSGVTPLAYHFERPTIVTNVGGLPAMVPHDKAGLVCEPNAKAIADAIIQFYQIGEAYFIPHLRNEKEKFSWKNLVSAVLELGNKIPA